MSYRRYGSAPAPDMRYPLQTEGTNLDVGTTDDPGWKTLHLRLLFAPVAFGINSTHATHNLRMNIRAALATCLRRQVLSKDAYEDLVRLLTGQEKKLSDLRGEVEKLKADAGAPKASTSLESDIREMEAGHSALQQASRERGAEIERLNYHLHERDELVRQLEALLSDQNATLQEQDRANRELRADLRACEEQRTYERARRKAEVNALRKQVDGGRRATGQREDRNSGRLFEQEKKIKVMQQRMAESADAREEQDTALVLAAAFQKDAYEKRQQLGRSLESRDHQITSLQGQVSNLQNHIYQLTHANNWDEATGAALEGQAAANLIFVQRLQADLADRDSRLEEVRTAKLSSEREAEEHCAALVGENRKVADELRIANSHLVQTKEAAANADIWAEKWKGRAEELGALIKKLIATDQSG